MFGQNSSKPDFLKTIGYDVYSPILNDWSFKESVETAKYNLLATDPDVIVGSSRGGAVAMNLNCEKPLLLLSPAWRFFGSADKINSNSIIIHSMNDNLVPIKDSEKLCKNSLCRLIIAGEDHRLNCSDAKEAIAFALNKILSN